MKQNYSNISLLLKFTNTLENKKLNYILKKHHQSAVRPRPPKFQHDMLSVGTYWFWLCVEMVHSSLIFWKRKETSIFLMLYQVWHSDIVHTHSKKNDSKQFSVRLSNNVLFYHPSDQAASLTM